jgi:hypothetical protein
MMDGNEQVIAAVENESPEVREIYTLYDAYLLIYTLTGMR